ncbi:hypothetical protein J7I93_00945 [Bacillus sp. ISL-47]|uniref:hypothetical protein n=1 Tax=Bacillus sp. ISL-47 TaxID=2819130 RepID=UPI001BE8C651|nr:hypothetical protein [Bacillus sp. ISL-47]MBT2686742.1 hypothetical protein [Bacillus sp. ISL-47]MBT2706910.1 hypothetical protein [Pseudomonas sp. ISL-84]
MEQILKAIQQLENQMNNRFDNVDQRFIEVDHRFDKVDQKFIEVDQRFDKVDQKFIEVDQRFDKVEQKLVEVDHRFDEVNQKLAENDKQFGEMDQKLDRIETTLNTIAQTSTDDTVSILKRIDMNTKNMNRDIEYLSKQVGKHELYFNRINKN